MPDGTRWCAVALACLALPVLPAAAQQAPTAERQVLDVFLDCQTFFCDFDHFRREIRFVNWMRDQRDADVHVLVTAQQTGGGGWQFTLAFIGRGAFTGQVDTLGFTSINTDTQAEVRDGLTRVIKLGLVRYAGRTAIASRLDVTYEAPEAEAQQARPEDDPWNFWTFSVGLNGSLNGEAQQNRRSLGGNFSARRVTDAFKIDFGVSGSNRREQYELDDSTTFINKSESYSSDLLLARSLGAHWSLGFRAAASRSTYSNRDLGLSG